MTMDLAQLEHDLKQTQLELARLQTKMTAYDRILKANPGLLQILTNGKMNGVMTFEQFPITPSSAPTDDYHVSNKKYVDDNVGGSSVTFLTTPLTSTSWDGDSISTNNKTKIDLSSVFGAPAGIRGILGKVLVRDSGSYSGNSFFALSPNNVANSNSFILRLEGLANDMRRSLPVLISCDENGDIYYQNYTSGVGTMDVWIEIWGYWS